MIKSTLHQHQITDYATALIRLPLSKILMELAESEKGATNASCDDVLSEEFCS